MYDLVLQVPILGLEYERFGALLIAALAGGAFGAALGALPSFIFTGFVVLLGEGVGALQAQLVEAGASGLVLDISGTIGFGPVVGPHIAFAGGVAATAYAGKRYPEMEPAGWDYHFGKDIPYAFGTKPDVLLVGALFGVLGMLLNQLGAGIGLPLDTIALSVFLTAIVARVAFGYPLIGTPAGSGLLDMTPFEREETRPGSDRLATEPWLPHQYTWAGVGTIGLVGGVLGGWTWLLTGSMFMAYGISAASLLFLNLGVEKIPVTHHMTLLGSAGAMIAAAAVGSEPLILIVAALFGCLSGLFGELTQRVFYAHSGTHVDPPAMAITIMTLLIGVLYLLGLLPNAAYLGL
ncbi:hypothetical protein [Halalkalicoccus jeotgali]|uniref:DUF7973 domain-containing protein n=1 Tax=Halalkalicoccus jeotgali (strain DSM 18796 / CECT 7217 / JCM 14584 / KCTC 4019 / B3) TaxID=795797 RepID=D8J4Q1_HALJB|nr:hypothetical protein [Halalkalicoccus jeotgali]ADJ15518.1 hypothetical protein HacjB3_10675 [Halalkalicoccus jeotgali B3]ELY36073.1 hypothetical protein C497_11992 [Halalkalicoccus jeotgali B3]